MKNVFKRKLRPIKKLNWKKVVEAWENVSDFEFHVSFKDFFETIISSYKESAISFLRTIKKSHTLPKKVSIQFEKLSTQNQIQCFFSLFRYVFPYGELEKFVRQPNFQPKNIKKWFKNDYSHIPLVFESICYLYQKLLATMDDDINFYNKYAPELAFTFGKLLVPNSARHIISDTFHLDHIFISPIFISTYSVCALNSSSTSGNNSAFGSSSVYTSSSIDIDRQLDGDLLNHVPAFCMIDEQGEISIYHVNDNSLITIIDQSNVTGLMEEEKLHFYNDANFPLITLEFPHYENATSAFLFSQNPPKRGFMQLTAFLHSISAFKTISTFFPSDLVRLPFEFTENLQKCIRTSSMEMLLYEFVIPADEVKVSQNNIEFYLDAIGDNFLPFARALVQLNWMMTPFGGQLILRQNSQLTVLCRMFLRIFAADYMDYIFNEMKSIIETGGALIKAMPIADDADAKVFIEKIFNPLANLILDSIPKMPSTLRSLLRILFVRCAGFYVNQSSPYLVIPNLLLLRFLIPPFTEYCVASYRSDPKMSKLAQLASSSLLSLFYQLGWSEDKEPVLSKYVSEVEKLFPRLEQFEYDVMDCKDFEYDYKNILKPQENDINQLIDLVSGSAERVILMNLKDPNKVLNSHPFCVSLMQMIEEYSFDFTTNANQ